MNLEMINTIGVLQKRLNKKTTSNPKNRLFHLTENINQKVCQSIEDVILHKDFYRGFMKVVRLNPEYKTYRFREIIKKIQNKDTLNEKEEIILLNFLENKKVNKIAEKFYGKMRGADVDTTIELKNKYPPQRIINKLKKYISYSIRKTFEDEKYIKNTIPTNYEKTLTPGKEYTTIFGKNFNGDNYTLLLLKDGVAGDNTENKMCIKKEGDPIHAHDFIYDEIAGIGEGNTREESFSKTRIGNKRVYKNLLEIENPKTEKYKLFDEVSYIRKVNGQMIYFAKIGNKEGRIRAGHEKEDRNNIVFKKVDRISVELVEGKQYYKGIIGDKEGYFDFDTPITKTDLARMSKRTKKIEIDTDGTHYYSYGKKNRLKKRKKHYFAKKWIETNQTKNTIQNNKPNNTAIIDQTSI